MIESDFIKRLSVNEETDEAYLNFRDKMNELRAMADAGDAQAALVVYGALAQVADTSPMMREQAYHYASIAAKAEHPSGYFALSALLRLNGGEENEQKAEQYLRKAIKLGHFEAPGELGRFLLDRNENLQEAVELLQRAVSRGCTEYMYDLYDGFKKLGNDVAAFKTAVNWVKKIPSDGVAYYYLGCCYLQGAGTSCNNHKAVDAFRRGADLGNIKCELMLANAYYQGIGTSKKPQKGTDLLRKVISKLDDDSFALILMGVFNEVLPHVPVDEVEALAQTLAAYSEKEAVATAFRQYVQAYGLESLPAPLQKLMAQFA